MPGAVRFWDRRGDCPRAHLSPSPDAAGIRSRRKPPPPAARGSPASRGGTNPTGLTAWRWRCSRRQAGCDTGRSRLRGRLSHLRRPAGIRLRPRPRSAALAGSVVGTRTIPAVVALLGSLGFRRPRGLGGSVLAFVLTDPSAGSPCPSIASATGVAAILASPCHRRTRVGPGGGVRTLPRLGGPSAPCRPSPFGLKGWPALSSERRPRSGLDL